MTSRQFNGIYRPLIKDAWLRHCSKQGVAPNNKTAYNLWYQSLLMDLTGGKLSSTKGASVKIQTILIDRLNAMLGTVDSIIIVGRWSDAQITRFRKLANAAYRSAKLSRQIPEFHPWLTSICTRNGYPVTDTGSLCFPDNKESFDCIMADLAVIANDEYWIRRTAEAAELRMRWQITQFLLDLDYLDKRFIHGWDYIQSIYKQSGLLPSDINDCPAQILWRVLQMLDTHIRRICKDFDVRPMDLPTRSHFHLHITISEQAKHLHLGHELEHVSAPITVAADSIQETSDAIPF